MGPQVFGGNRLKNKAIEFDFFSPKKVIMLAHDSALRPDG